MPHLHNSDFRFGFGFGFDFGFGFGFAKEFDSCFEIAFAYDWQKEKTKHANQAALVGRVLVFHTFRVFHMFHAYSAYRSRPESERSKPEIHQGRGSGCEIQTTKRENKAGVGVGVGVGVP